MGNCLFIQERVVQVMRTNGEVLEYKSPIKVYEILSEFAGHAIADKISVHNHLSPDDELLEGHLYYLMPIIPCPKVDTKRIDQPNQTTEAGQGAGVLRIKFRSVRAYKTKVTYRYDIVSRASERFSESNQSSPKNTDSCAKVSCQGWAPILESIPEVN
ncbi:hypothetical protein Leryth_006754 [Lithospermum erythrorhizon]|nr:hypothetical protein Leryth_006754 [Lithospermum erythrorhizon]